MDAATALIRFVGLDGADQPETDGIFLLALLIDARYSPKMQFFATCEVVGRPGRFNPVVVPVPYTACLSCAPPRLPGNEDIRALSVVTSDELCLTLLSEKPVWKFGPVKNKIRCDVPHLLWVEVDGLEPFFEAANTKAAAKKAAPGPAF